jgi:hypothetical protein
MFTKGTRKKKEIKRIITKIEETKNNKYRLNSEFFFLKKPTGGPRKKHANKKK